MSLALTTKTGRGIFSLVTIPWYQKEKKLWNNCGNSMLQKKKNSADGGGKESKERE